MRGRARERVKKTPECVDDEARTVTRLLRLAQYPWGNVFRGREEER